MQGINHITPDLNAAIGAFHPTFFRCVLSAKRNEIRTNTLQQAALAIALPDRNRTCETRLVNSIIVLLLNNIMKRESEICLCR